MKKESKNFRQNEALNIARVSRRNSLRYRLHYKIRKDGFVLITKERTIQYPYGKEISENKYLQRLIREFGYAVQFTL